MPLLCCSPKAYTTIFCPRTVGTAGLSCTEPEITVVPQAYSQGRGTAGRGGGQMLPGARIPSTFSHFGGLR